MPNWKAEGFKGDTRDYTPDGRREIETLLLYGDVRITPGARACSVENAMYHTSLFNEFVGLVQEGSAVAESHDVGGTKEYVSKLERLNRKLRFGGVASLGREMMNLAEGHPTPFYYSMD